MNVRSNRVWMPVLTLLAMSQMLAPSAKADLGGEYIGDWTSNEDSGAYNLLKNAFDLTIAVTGTTVSFTDFKGATFLNKLSFAIAGDGTLSLNGQTVGTYSKSLIKLSFPVAVSGSISFPYNVTISENPDGSMSFSDEIVGDNKKFAHLRNTSVVKAAVAASTTKPKLRGELLRERGLQLVQQ